MRLPLIPSLAALAVVILTVSLGNWQMRRGDQKMAAQQQRERALASEPVSVGPQTQDAAALDGRRVAIEGRYEPERTIFIDNRSRRGLAGVHVVTPLRLTDDDRRVLVLRGWAARDLADRNRLPEVQTPNGTVRVEGIALSELPQALQLGEEPVPGPGDRAWLFFSIPKFQRWAGVPVHGVIVRQTNELSDGLARDWAQPGTDVAKHRGYAVQWYALAATTAALWVWFVVLVPARAARHETRGDGSGS